jgi:long-chain acyl-CoA synthetase
MLSLHQDFKITDLNGTLNASEINAKLDAVSQILAGINFKVMGVLMDNTIDWVILDLYAHRQNKTFVPIPSFFTAQQKQFLIEKAKVELLISHDKNLNAPLGFDNDYFFLDDMVISNKANLLAKNQSNFQKISFTSGTTSEPKGVELSSEGQWEVAKGLLNQLQDLNLKKHMSLLPFGVLF